MTSQISTRTIRLAGFASVIGLLALIFVFAVRQEATMEPLSLEEASRFDVPRYRSSFSPKNQSDDAKGRGEYEIMRLRDPSTGDIPFGMREKELEFVRGIPKSIELAQKMGRLATEQWSFLGPQNVGGRTRALAVDLDYNGSTNRRILAGGISGGMYLSEDDGQTWTLTSSLSAMASVTSLVQDPVNRNVWYHGTGEFLGNSAGGGLGFSQFLGEGLFKSTNGGRTWAPVLSTRAGSPTAFDNLWDVVWNLAVYANGTVLAATYGGIHRSTDGGGSWQYVLGSDNSPFSTITDVTIASNGVAYATLSRNGSGTNTYGVFKSTDGGSQWQPISPPGLANDPYRMVINTAPSNPNIAYLLVQANQQGATSADHQLFRYDDSSGNWSNLSANLPNEQGAEGNASFSTQGGYDQMIAVKPDDPNTIFVGGVNLYRSTNGGNTFTRIGGYATAANYNGYPNHHSDQHSLSFLPTNPNAAISGHDGGLSKTTNILAEPHNWTSLNNGYITTQFYTVAMDPQAGGSFVMGGTQDNGTWATNSTSGSEDWSELFGGDGAYAAVTPGAGTIYVSAQNGVTFRFTNSGFAFVTPQNANQFMFINPFVLDPNDPRVMYMGEAGGLWRNSDLTGIPDGNQQPTSINWTFLNASARSGSQTTTVAAARTPANRVYFGTTNFQSQTALVRLDNAQSNTSGTVITPPVTSQPFAPYPAAIAIHPANGDEIMAVFSNYNTESIWHSTNAGASWTNVEGNLGGANGPSVRTAAIVPTSAGTMYFVGTSTGIYSTANLNDSGTIWAHEGSDVLGNVVVDMLVVRPEDGVMVAGTHGRGTYRAVIGEGGTGAVATLDVNALDIAVQPGATASTTFTLTNSGSAALNFSVGGVGKTDHVVSRHRLEPHTGVQPPLARPSDAASGTAGPHPQRANAPPGGSEQVVPFSGDLIVIDSGANTPDDFLGWGDGFTAFQWGNRFVTPVGGFRLESFFSYMRSEDQFSFPVSVFITDQNGNVFVSGTVPLLPSSHGTWYQITLNNPILFAEGQIFDIELVAPGSVRFPAGAHTTSQVPGAGYYWVSAGMGGSYAELSSVQGFENGAFMIRAEGTAQAGSVNQPPVAVIVASKTTAAVSETITFDGSGSSDPDGNITQYAWSFGDGATSNQAIAQHAYAAAGVYTVTLTVTDNQGATGQASRQINVASGNQPPVASIQVSKNQAQVSETITFDGSTSTDPDGSIVGFLWDFGDGNTSNQAATSHAYSQAGTYTARLTVTDNEGATGQASIQLSILAEAPRLTVSPQSGSIGAGQSQVITVTYDATTQASGSYSGQITVLTNGGSFNIPVSILVDPTVDAEPGTELPRQLTLHQNYPNPFNPATTIQFTLDRPANLRLTVFDINGRAVRVLLDESKHPGSHRVTWEGDDASGQAVASGTYFYHIEAFPHGGEAPSHFTRKMVLLR